VGHTWGIARALNSFGDLAHYQGDSRRAAAFYEESLALRRQVHDKQGIAVSLNNLGKLAARGGDLERATALCQESLALRRELGDRRGVAVSLGSLGIVAMRQGDAERSAALSRESLTLRWNMGDKVGIACCLEALAVVAVADHQSERAARLLGAADSVRDAIGAPLPPADRADHEHTVARIRATLTEEAFIRAWTEGRTAPLEESLACDPSAGRPVTARLWRTAPDTLTGSEGQ
jgi:tetratricopeptide (TPR) repeat protein